MSVLRFPLYKKQLAFVNSATRYAGLITGVGYGKTHTGVVKLIRACLEIEGCIALVLAPTYSQMAASTKKTFFRMIPKELIAWNRESQDNQSTGIYNLHGGVSEILWRSASKPDSYRGVSCHVFWLDEAGQMEEEAFLQAIARHRLGTDEQQKGWVTTTARGVDHWVYDKFGVDPDTGEQVNKDPLYSVWTAETLENKKGLTAGTLDAYYSQYKGDWAAQELGGKFVRFKGQVYSAFDRKAHVVPIYDDPDLGIVGRDLYVPGLPVDLAWDFGMRDPEAVLAIQQDAYGNVNLIDEVYLYDSLTEDAAAVVLGKPWFPRVRDCVCDSARPDSILRLRKMGITWAREAHKGSIRDGIKLTQELFGTNITTGRPRLQISSQCENLIQELKKYRWRERKAGTGQWIENPIDADNHALDALRYWVTTKWRAPRAAPLEKRPPKRTVLAYQLL